MTKNDLTLIPGNQQLLDNPTTPAFKTSISTTTTNSSTPGQKPKNLKSYDLAMKQKSAQNLVATPKKGNLRLVYSKPALILALMAGLMSPKPASADMTPSVGWALAQIDAEKGKQIAKDEKSMTVAVIDTGIDVNHPDLKNNLWINTGETGIDAQGKDKSKNGKDDDGNGYVDDLHGWNFVNGNNDLTDQLQHGTHIAGIIASPKGVAPSAKLMVLKYFNPKATDRQNLENTISAIRYAIKMKANIINYSAGGLEKSALEEQVITEARDNNILFVAAAGNEKNNSDLRGFYPADYDLVNILSVTAVDSEKRVLESSNYGSRTVDVAAPGKNIFSTVPGGKYGYMTGTSQATAFVSGIAALLMSSQSHLNTPAKVIRHILASANLEATLVGKTKSKSLVNSYRALAMQDQNTDAMGEQLENSKRLPSSSQNMFYPDKIWNAN